MKIAGIGKIMLSSVMAMSVMALAACGPGSTASSSSTSEAVSTDLGTDKISLTLWDGAGMKDYDNALIKAFEKKYTNVTITATYDPDNTPAQNGPRIIASSSAPDIARITDISSAVKGKHVVNLDSYAKAYNWSIPDSQTAVYRVSDSTGRLGQPLRSPRWSVFNGNVLEQGRGEGAGNNLGADHYRRA